MEERFWWRCNTEVKMLDDYEFKLCRDAWFEGKKVVEKELEKRNIKDFVWLDKIETFEQYRYLLEMYRILTGEYESNPLAILHHQSSQFGKDCPNCKKPFRTSRAIYCASCGYGSENLTKI
ncbi:hypothetical protein [Flavobacterium nitrogenifigens]|uniref:Uncharacterized protein n=1 Tax=Flavobacterium nitrogenifigens TaxID=1617283 RepID=A0A521ALV4_9FLAO|nr:hypothetical protein [Flavobacterium nitrogenifigens]KAF2331659.1 hypothetical protein DM397_13065 [Flavobacterium nitrogenifigens]SMO35798.1 hypothetical protein SAMN06265220_101266 [Flavobacterium nitrogenifigens]